MRWLLTDDRCGRCIGGEAQTAGHAVAYFERPTPSGHGSGYGLAGVVRSAGGCDVLVVVDARVHVQGKRWAAPSRDDISALKRRGVAVVFIETRDPVAFDAWSKGCRCKSRGAKPWDCSVYATTDMGAWSSASGRVRSVWFRPDDYAGASSRLLDAVTHVRSGVTYVPSRDGARWA